MHIPSLEDHPVRCPLVLVVNPPELDKVRVGEEVGTDLKMNKWSKKVISLHLR